MDMKKRSSLSARLIRFLYYTNFLNSHNVYLLIQITDESTSPIEVTHFKFVNWFDHGVPTDKSCMIAFIKHIRQSHPPEGPPLVVHCSAGVGRTGTFIVLDTMLQRMAHEDTLNIFEYVLNIRQQRIKMVQTEASKIETKLFPGLIMLIISPSGSVYVYP